MSLYLLESQQWCSHSLEGEDLTKYEICSLNSGKAMLCLIIFRSYRKTFLIHISSVATDGSMSGLARGFEKKPLWLGRSNIQIDHYFFPCLPLLSDRALCVCAFVLPVIILYSASVLCSARAALVSCTLNILPLHLLGPSSSS